MAAILMSNPLHLAVLGNPRRRLSKEFPMAKRRRSRRSYKRNPVMLAGNPRRRSRRRVARRNPTLAATGRTYVRGLTGTPGNVMKIFQGKKKIQNTMVVAGGTIGTYLLGGIIGGRLGEMLARIPGIGTNVIGQRILPALVPYTIGFVGSRFVKQKDLKTALMVGGGLASVIELLMPGQVGRFIEMIPGVRNLAMTQPVVAAADAGPVAQAQEGIGRMMLAGYVTAPSYSGSAGLAEYVTAPSYQGSAGLAEYVTAPSYQGSAGLGQEMLAGNYLEDSSMFQPAI
jgi:hypothetical protein